MSDSSYEQPSLNPYAASTALPMSEPAGIGIPPSGEPGDLRIASILRSSWDIFKLHWGHAIVALFVIFAIDAWVGLAFNVLEKFLLKGIGDPVLVLPFVILYMFLRFVLHLWLCTGWIIFIVRCIQGHAPDITYLFRSKLYFPRVLGAVLLRTMMIGLIFGFIELMIAILHYTVRPFSLDGETEVDPISCTTKRVVSVKGCVVV
ncbi:MAG: hypothetical protein K8T91_19150 [Planctomycetes bacterium]|nr:hypothetical protein [Planctomycetota bacterium]